MLGLISNVCHSPGRGKGRMLAILGGYDLSGSFQMLNSAENPKTVVSGASPHGAK